MFMLGDVHHQVNALIHQGGFGWWQKVEKGGAVFVRVLLQDHLAEADPNPSLQFSEPGL